MTDDLDLGLAIIMATSAHAGQKDKGGAPYILHPLRVMLACKTDAERIVAVLHDVLEDSAEYTLPDMAERFGDDISAALDAITKRKGERYDEYLDRVTANPMAASVKLADLSDNIDLRRLGREPTAEDFKRRAKYQEAAGYIFNSKQASL